MPSTIQPVYEEVLLRTVRSWVLFKVHEAHTAFECGGSIWGRVSQSLQIGWGKWRPDSCLQLLF
jgi:hypothetical protein